MAIFDPSDIKNGEEISKKLDEIIKKSKEVEYLEKALGKETLGRIRSQKTLSRELKIAMAAEKKLSGTVIERQEAYRGLTSEEKKAADSFFREIKKSSKVAEEFGDYIKELGKDIEELSSSGGRGLDNLTKKYERLTKAASYAQGPKLRDALKGRASGLSRSIFGADAIGEIGSGMKTGRGSFARAGLDLTGMGDKLSGGTSKLSSVLGKAGPMFGSVASAAGSFLTKFTPVGAALGVVGGAAVFAVKAILKLDSFIKNLNNRFLELAGPTVGMDAIKQMKKFNDSLFDTGQKLRLGLKSEDMNKMFGAMGSQGLSAPGVEKSLGSYSKVIEEARKMSLQFGVSLESMGSKMADQVLELRSSLDEVKDGFDAMSYSAAKAGIQGEKFYQAVEASTSSLGFYGNYLKYASGLLEDFTSKGISGLKGATSAATSILGSMRDPEQNRKFVAMLKKQSISIVEGMVSEYDRQIKDVDTRLSTLKKLLEKGSFNDEISMEIAQLNKERDKLEANRSIPGLAAETGDFQLLATALTQISDPLIMAAAIFKKMKLDVTTKKGLAAFNIFTKTLGYSTEATMQLTREMITLGDQAIKFFDKYKENLENLQSADNAGNVDKINEYLVSLNSKEKGWQEVSGDMKQLVSGLEGVPKDFAEEFLKMSERFPQFASEFISGLYSSDKKQRETNIRTGAQYSTLRGRDKGNLLSQTKKQTEELVASVTTAQKYLDISKEGVEYALAGSDMMKNISVFTYNTAKHAEGILRLLQKKKAEREQAKFDTFKNSPEAQAVANAIVARTELGKSTSSDISGSRLSEIDPKILKLVAAKYANESTRLDAINDIETALGSGTDQVSREFLQDFMKKMEQLAQMEKIAEDAKIDLDPKYYEYAENLAVELGKNANATRNLEKALFLKGKINENDTGEDAVNSFKKFLDNVVKNMGEDSKNDFAVLFNKAVGKGDNAKDNKALGELLKIVDNTEKFSIDPTIGRIVKDFLKLVGTGSFDAAQWGRVELANSYKKKDFSFGTGGWVLGSPGDLLVDKDSLASGLGTSTGGLASQAARKMGQVGTTVANNWGGITIHMTGGDSASVREAIPELKRALDGYVDQKFKRFALSQATKA